MRAKGAGRCWLLNNHDQNGEGCVRGSSSTEAMRLIRGGEWGGMGVGILVRYTVTTRKTPALRWAAMRAILVFD